MQLHIAKGMKALMALAPAAFLMTTLAFSMVTPNERVFTNDQEAKVKGVIVSRDANTLKLRGDDDAIGTIDLTGTTKIEMKHGMFGWSKSGMEANSLVPGLRVEAHG